MGFSGYNGTTDVVRNKPTARYQNDDANNAGQRIIAWISAGSPLKFQMSSIHAHGSKGARGEGSGRRGVGEGVVTDEQRRGWYGDVIIYERSPQRFIKGLL